MRRLSFVMLAGTLLSTPGPAATPAVAAAPARAEAQPDRSRNLTCAPSPEVKAALAKVPRRDPECDPSEDCWLTKIRAAEALVDRYPFDVHVHRRYMDLVSARINETAAHSNEAAAADKDAKDPLAQAISERYARFAAEHPADPLPHYLLARLNDDAKEARKSLELNPTFPWPHALLALLLHASGATEGGSKAGDGATGGDAATAGNAGAELETFSRLCPNRFDEVLRRDIDIGGPEVWRRMLPGARAAMLKGPPADQMLWYPTLWDREFAAWPPDQHAAVRRRLRDDLARIEGWKLRGDEAWWALLQSGYKMLDDPPALERVEAAYARRFPCSDAGIERTLTPFTESRGGWELYYEQSQPQWRDAFDKAGRWLKTCPDQYQYLALRFKAATRLDDLDDRALVAEADRFLAGWDRISNDWNVSPSPYSEVAAEFLSRGIEPQRALDLARKSQEALAAERKRREAWPLNEEQKRDAESGDRVATFGALGMIAEATLATAGDGSAATAARRAESAAGGHRAESATAALRETEATLAEADALYERFTDKERLLLPYTAGSRSRYWRVHARLAEAAQRPPDALAWWRFAIEQADARENPRTAANDKAALDHLWRSLGGTDAALAAWMAPSSAPTAVAKADGAEAGVAAGGAAAGESLWESRDTPLPPFSLTDTAGRTWKLADLAGKTVFINVWATWCGPCRAELPHLRELDKRLAGRPDVVLLAFNTDASQGAVEPFVRANKVTWPVLFAADYFDRLNDASGVPQNWVVDGAGVRRRVQVGFDPLHADRWVTDTLALIDRIAATHP